MSLEESPSWDTSHFPEESTKWRSCEVFTEQAFLFFKKESIPNLESLFKTLNTLLYWINVKVTKHRHGIPICFIYCLKCCIISVVVIITVHYYYHYEWCPDHYIFAIFLPVHTHTHTQLLTMRICFRVCNIIQIKENKKIEGIRQRKYRQNCFIQIPFTTSTYFLSLKPSLAFTISILHFIPFFFRFLSCSFFRVTSISSQPVSIFLISTHLPSFIHLFCSLILIHSLYMTKLPSFILVSHSALILHSHSFRLHFGHCCSGGHILKLVNYSCCTSHVLPVFSRTYGTWQQNAQNWKYNFPEEEVNYLPKN